MVIALRAVISQGEVNFDLINSARMYGAVSMNAVGGGRVGVQHADGCTVRRWSKEPTATRIDGSLHPDFLPVARVFRDILGRYPGGGAVCVYHRGACVVDLWGGSRDAAGRPWTRDTMAPSFSITKGIASTLLHVMVDRGLLDYDDRVATYWPEFAQAGKADVTIRQVLARGDQALGPREVA
jgi:CubicO group peptidase (beta-lactamase class C family)